MLSNYLPVLIFLIVAILMAIAIPLLSKTISFFTKINDPHPAKRSAFECGFGEFDDARSRFDVRFYLVAILFIVFDLEVAFLFPWSVVIHQIGWYGFGAMGVFLLLLVIGFIYEWKKGALEWE